MNTVHPEKGSKLEEAVRYSLNQKEHLMTYLDHGEVPISNNLAESAKANGIEPFAYLQHVLVQLPYLGKNQSHEELESLMPWAPYIQENFKMKNSNAYENCYLD